jgi:hypothetical protein
VLVPCNFLIDIKLIPSPLGGRVRERGAVGIIAAGCSYPHPQPLPQGEGSFFRNIKSYKVLVHMSRPMTTQMRCRETVTGKQ